MKIDGEYRCSAPRDRVWEALNDIDFLRRAWPGCESMEKLSENEFSARVRSKIGAIRAIFESRILLTQLNPPESYKLVGKGLAGALGFARGEVQVYLIDEGGLTVLRYQGEMQVGGKLARVGNRLVGGVARKTADEFFASLATTVSESSGSH